MANPNPSPFLLEVGRRGRRIRLQFGVVIIGRHPRKCQMIFEHPAISRQHCQLVVDRRAVLIRDLQSSNGTFVNGRRVEEIELVDGDCIRIGKAILKLVWVGPPGTDEKLPLCPVAHPEVVEADDATEYQMPTRVSHRPSPGPAASGGIPPADGSDDDVIPDPLLDILFDDEP